MILIDYALKISATKAILTQEIIIMLKLYEVAGEDVTFRPSPYCWRTRMALAHKGLEFESVPWRAVEKEVIARSGGETVPVLVDGEDWIRDSWDIAIYLDKAFAHLPILLSGEGNQAKARFLESWTNQVIHPIMLRAVIQEQFPLLAKIDKPYYRKRTKAKFSCTVDELGNDPEGAVAELQKILAPLQDLLGRCHYFGGSGPDYGDYIVFGTFQWARVASSRLIIPTDTPLAHWFLDLQGRFDGFAAMQPPRSYWENY